MRKRRTSDRLQAKQAPEMRAHVLNLAAAIDEHYPQAQVVHQRAQLGVQGLEWCVRRLFQPG